jgi:hypothetical protein
MLKNAKQRRAPGGGRKRLTDLDHSLLDDLKRLVGVPTVGTLQPALAWSCKSTAQLAEELTRMGHTVSQRSVHGILSELGFELSAAGRTPHDRRGDRDSQFRFVSRMAQSYIDAGCAVVSLRVRFGEWGGSERKSTVSACSESNSGCSVPDVSLIPLAVDLLQSWWRGIGSHTYTDHKRILLIIDVRGADARRIARWKGRLQQMASDCNLTVVVCHLPPGTFRWHRREQALTCDIARGKDLTGLLCVQMHLIGSLPSESTGKSNRCTRVPNHDHEWWSYEISPRSNAV